MAPSDPPAPTALSFFTKEKIAARKADEAWEETKTALCHQARSLRELQAFIEWEAYLKPIKQALFWTLLENPAPAFALHLQSTLKDWETSSDEQKGQNFHLIVNELAACFGVRPPSFLTWAEYSRTLEPGDGKLGQQNAIYSPRTQTISIARPDIWSGSFWHALGMILHEFAHHLIRVQSLNLFENLGDNLDRVKFSRDIDLDRSVVTDHPLITVISACTEFANDPAYWQEYNDEYFSSAEDVLPSFDDFLEESLAAFFETILGEYIREAIMLSVHGYQEPCAAGYARIVHDLANDCYKSAKALIPGYSHEAFEKIAAKGTAPDEDFYAAVSEVADAVESMAMHNQHQLLQTWNSAIQDIGFLAFSYSRFNAYSEIS